MKFHVIIVETHELVAFEGKSNRLRIFDFVSKEIKALFFDGDRV